MPRNKRENRYPPDWPARSRFIIKYRARNQCEKCGAENGKPHPITGNKCFLTVAHIHDPDPANCSFFNLAALCPLCHNRLDGYARNETIKRDKLDAILFSEGIL